MSYWNKELPESDLPKSQTLFWMPCDTEESFRKNQTPGYTETSVRYHLNRHGYRGTEFDESADFKILVSGCSHTFGIGINEDDIWCNQFAKRIPGAKVYNLALGGRSPDYTVRSIYKTIDIIKPDLVMVLWPDRSRLELPAHNKIDMAWWTPGDLGDDYPRWFVEGYTQDYHFERNQILLTELCGNRQIPLIDYEYPGLRHKFDRIRDQARDVMHDGPKWNGAVADFYWEQYNLLTQSS